MRTFLIYWILLFFLFSEESIGQEFQPVERPKILSELGVTILGDIHHASRLGYTGLTQYEGFDERFAFRAGLYSELDFQKLRKFFFIHAEAGWTKYPGWRRVVNPSIVPPETFVERFNSIYSVLGITRYLTIRNATCLIGLSLRQDILLIQDNSEGDFEPRTYIPSIELKIGIVLSSISNRLVFEIRFSHNLSSTRQGPTRDLHLILSSGLSINITQ